MANDTRATRLRGLRKMSLKTRAYIAIFVIAAALLLFEMSLGWMRADSLIVAFVLTAIVLLARDHPRFSLVAFAITFTLPATFSVGRSLAGFALAAILVAVIAFIRIRSLTVTAVAVLGVVGTINPGEYNLGFDFFAASTWLAVLIVSAAFGALVGSKKAERESLLADFARQSQRRKEELTGLLHDSVIASLTVMSLRADAVAGELQDTNPEIASIIEGIGETGRASISDIRTLISTIETDWNASEEGVHTIPEILAQCRHELTHQGFNVSIEQKAWADVAPETARVLEQIMREATINAVKYANTRSPIHIGVQSEHPDIAITMSNRVDETKQKEIAKGGVLSSGFGLASIMSNAQRVGGKVKVGSDDEGIFTLRVLLPAEAI